MEKAKSTRIAKTKSQAPPTLPPLPPVLPLVLRDLLPASLQAVCEWRSARRTELLFRQGERPRSLYFVARGEVVLQRDGSQGDSLVLQRVRQGFVAEASLRSAAYHCDAVVTAPAELFGIAIAQLKLALRDDPAFAGRWIVMLSQELIRLRAQCERLSLKGVRPRLLHLLETTSSASSDGRLALDAGLKSVASELGVTHEALYRCVATLERQGLLRRADGAMWLLPPA